MASGTNTRLFVDTSGDGNLGAGDMEIRFASNVSGLGVSDIIFTH